MPKRGKGQRSWTRDRQSDGISEFYEHDDRGISNDNIRRVSFKPNHRTIKKHSRLVNHISVSRVNKLLDDDFDMGGQQLEAGSSRGPRSAQFTRGGFSRRGRGGRMRPNTGYQQNKILDQTGWFRIMLPFGAKHDKNFLLGVLKSHIAPIELLPIAYRIENNDAVFFVDELKVAEALQEADRKISIDDRFKLCVRVSPGMPRVDMNDALQERIKLAMVKRYNSVTKALDLSRFHRDSDLVEDSFCAVSRPQVLNAILQVISENIPELQALNLDSNNFVVGDMLAAVTRKVPSLKILYLGANRLRDLASLSVLKSLPLVELKLEGNPLCQKFSKNDDYTRAVRKIFAKLARLDGVDLPPVISFDVEEDIKNRLPPCRPSFLCSEDGRDVARQFIEQYFALYDAGEGATRQPLLEAYHDLAVFSMTSVYPPGQGKPEGPKLTTYISDSRNLLRINDSERRHKMLRFSKLGIVGFLCELPRTQHDPSSFSLDLTIFSQHLLSLTVAGVFREPGGKGTPPLRHFLRKFVLVPVGAGFCIINEMLFVTNALPSEAKKAFTPVPAIAVVPSPSIPVQVIPDAQKLQAIEALATQTNMNALWSRKCLEETGWDIQRALLAFAELNSQGRVPPEAFIK